MIEIARNYKIEYEPDPTMFLVSHSSHTQSHHHSCTHKLKSRGCNSEMEINILLAFSACQDDGVPPVMDMEKPFVDEGEPPVPHKQNLDTDRYVPLPQRPPQTHFPPPPAASSHFPPPPAATSHFPPPPQSQGSPGMPPGPNMSVCFMTCKQK